MYLGLPVSSNKSATYVKYFHNFFKELKHEYFDFQTPITINDNYYRNYTVKKLKTEIHKKFIEKKNSALEEIVFPRLLYCYDVVLLNSEKVFIKILDDDCEISNFLRRDDDEYEIVVYEKYYHKEQMENYDKIKEYITFYFNPVYFERKYFFFSSEICKINLFYPIQITISTKANLFDLYYLIFLVYREVIPDIEKEINLDDEDLYNEDKIKFKTDIKKFHDSFHLHDNEKYLIKEFRTFFDLDENLNFNPEEIPFELFYYNSKPESGFFYYFPFLKKKEICKFCGEKNCKLRILSCIKCFKSPNKSKFFI